MVEEASQLRPNIWAVKTSGLRQWLAMLLSQLRPNIWAVKTAMLLTGFSIRLSQLRPNIWAVKTTQFCVNRALPELAASPEYLGG